jgi:VTC domain
MEIDSILEKFTPISLSKISTVSLQDRVDTKFVFTRNKFGEILDILSREYKILEIDSRRVNKYRSRYFDTEEFESYLMHHNKRSNRYRVRFREYIGSDLCFLEVKRKVKGRTIKHRIQKDAMELELSNNSKEYINEILPSLESSLRLSVDNSFSRITLVNKKMSERLTIDFRLKFDGHKNNKINFESLIIAELKQSKMNSQSFFYKTMMSFGIRPTRFSKYSMGLLLLNDDLKQNRFKKQLLKLQRLNINVTRN